jgi:uncharacterized membrane protein YfcA
VNLPFDLGLGAVLWMSAAIFVAALVRGYSGFGYSAMVITASSLVTNPLNFVAVVVIAEAVMTLQSWSGLSHEVDWKRVKWLLAGAVIGMPLGLWALSYVSEDGARAVVSVYVLAMCLILLAGFRMAKEAGVWPTFGTGLASGLANAPGMGGLPVAAFFAAQPMAPAVFRATVVAYFPILDIFSAPMYWLAGLVTMDTVWASLLVLPLTLLGNWLGSRHFFNTDPQDFRRFAILLLAGLAGLGLLKAVIW